MAEVRSVITQQTHSTCHEMTQADRESGAQPRLSDPSCLDQTERVACGPRYMKSIRAGRDFVRASVGQVKLTVRMEDR